MLLIKIKNIMSILVKVIKLQYNTKNKIKVKNFINIIIVQRKLFL